MCTFIPNPEVPEGNFSRVNHKQNLKIFETVNGFVSSIPLGKSPGGKNNFEKFFSPIFISKIYLESANHSKNNEITFS